MGKTTKLSKRSFRDNVKEKMLEARMDSPLTGEYVLPSSVSRRQQADDDASSGSPPLTSAIITIVVGKDQRLFAAHEDVLCHSPYFAALIRDQFFDAGSARRIPLPYEEPEIFSCVLEYLYKGDYYPRLLHDKRRNTWMLEGFVGTPDLKQRGGRGASSSEPTIHHSGVGDVILRDTAVYCAAGRYRGRRYPAQRALRLREHAGQRLAPPRSLPRTHYPQPEDLQAQRYHADGDGDGRQIVLRSLRGDVQPHGRHCGDASASIFLTLCADRSSTVICILL